MTLEILLSRPVYTCRVDGVERGRRCCREAARRWRKKWTRTWRETERGATHRWRRGGRIKLHVTNRIEMAKKQRTNKHRSPLAYVEEAPCVAELRYLAVRRTFGWRGAAAGYAKSAGGFLNSAAKSAEKLGVASGKAGKQLGYALHRTPS